MTDARFPERWLNDRRIARLADRDFRTFMLTLAWSVSNRTEGFVAREDLELIPRADPGQGRVLAEAELWQVVDGGWLITDYAATQTPAAQLDAYDRKRRQDANRAKKYRANQRHPSRDESRDGSRDDKGKARPGEAGTQPPQEGGLGTKGAEDGKATTYRGDWPDIPEHLRTREPVP